VKNTPDSIVGAQVFAYASICSLAVMFWQWPVFPVSIVGFTYLALCVISLGLGSICMFYGISLIGSFKFSLFTKLEPVFTCLYSYMIISETLHPSQYLGIGLVLGSLIVYQLLEGRRA
jgi:drug/metabolite transporter (DMT)-like permease